MRKVGFVLSAVVLLAIALGPAFAAAAQPFSDVPRDHWAYNAIERLSQAGVVEGYPDGTFKGKRTMTRYEFAVAIARIMDQLGTGTPGPAGPQGPEGPAGPAGGSGGSALTPEQQALLDRLANEFAPELKSLRSDLDALKTRVEALEANKVKPPAVTVSGDIRWNTGAYGTKLSLKEGATDSTGYPAFNYPAAANGGSLVPNVAFGNIIVPATSNTPALAIPISDALKDAFKTNDFMAMRMHVDVTANVGSNGTAFLSLLASPNTDIMNRTPGSVTGSSISPSAFSGNGILGLAQIDQAWFKYGTRFVTPVEVTIGQQYLRRGQGLLFDNDQQALEGLRADFGTDRIRVGTFLAMLNPDAFFGRTSPVPFGIDQFGRPIGSAGGMYSASQSMYSKALAGNLSGYGSNGQDQYRLVYADFRVLPGWTIGGNWLDSGFGQEQGWSASLNGGVMGVDVYGEFSRLTRFPDGQKFADFNGDGVQTSNEVNLSDADSAWLAGLRWGNKWVNLTGEYGEVDALYAFSPTGAGWDAAGGGTFNLPLSALHPRAEIDPYDINWIDRPVFLDPTNIAKGYHIGVNLPTVLGPKNALSFSYANGSAYSTDYLAWLLNGGSNNSANSAQPDKWRDADPVWWVKLTHQMSDSVSANLLYGRRAADKVLSPGTTPVDAAGDFASTDAVQVIRAEVAVQF